MLLKWLLNNYFCFLLVKRICFWTCKNVLYLFQGILNIRSSKLVFWGETVVSEIIDEQLFLAFFFCSFGEKRVLFETKLGNYWECSLLLVFSLPRVCLPNYIYSIALYIFFPWAMTNYPQFSFLNDSNSSNNDSNWWY